MVTSTFVQLSLTSTILLGIDLCFVCLITQDRCLWTFLLCSLALLADHFLPLCVFTFVQDAPDFKIFICFMHLIVPAIFLLLTAYRFLFQLPCVHVAAMCPLPPFFELSPPFLPLPFVHDPLTARHASVPLFSFQFHALSCAPNFLRWLLCTPLQLQCMDTAILRLLSTHHCHLFAAVPISTGEIVSFRFCLIRVAVTLSTIMLFCPS